MILLSIDNQAPPFSCLVCKSSILHHPLLNLFKVIYFKVIYFKSSTSTIKEVY